MEMEERIVYDAGALVRDMENVLDELKRFWYDKRYSLLLGEDFIKKMIDWDSQIRMRKEDPFTLVVCGDFKRGKSSLINAFLGEETVPVNVTTETVTLNRIRYGSHANEAVLSKNRKMLLSDGELQKENLKEIIEKTGETITQLNIYRPLPILKNITIIDTPGLGDAFCDFSSLVGSALAQADAVVYVFSTSYPLSMPEQMFLKTAILPQRYTELFLVSNFADVMPDRKAFERMGEMIRKRIEGLLPGKRPYLLSALDENCRIIGAERPNHELCGALAENFQDFRLQIEKLVSDKKEFILPDRMGRLLGMMKEELEAFLAVMEKGISMDEESVKKAEIHLNEEMEKQAQIQAETQQKISDSVSLMKAEALTWMYEIINRMEGEVDSLQDIDAAVLSKYYSFYCVDLLQQSVNRCTQTHQEELYDQLEEISAGLAKGLADGPKKPYRFRFALDGKTWTNGDNVGYVLSQFHFGLLGLVADGFAGSMRQKEMAGKTPELLDSIHRQYDGVRNSVQKMVEETYGNMEQMAKTQLKSYYSDKMEAARLEMEQCAFVAGQNEENKQQARAAIQEIRDALNRE